MSDANGFQRTTGIFRFFNIKKMATNESKRAMNKGQKWVFEGDVTSVNRGATS